MLNDYEFSLDFYHPDAEIGDDDVGSGIPISENLYDFNRNLSIGYYLRLEDFYLELMCDNNKDA